MHLTVHADAQGFLRVVRDPLEVREAEHSLLLGSALALRDAGPNPEESQLLATVHDARGLALAALRASPYPLLLAACRDEVDTAVAALVDHLAGSGPEVHSLVAERGLAERFAERWMATGGRASEIVMQQRLYTLDEVLPVAAPPGELRLAGPEDVELVAGWMAAFDEEALGHGDPVRARAAAERRILASEIFLWEDPQPRAMAARARPTRRTIAVNAVYTPRDLRGRGFAGACVAALSRRLLAEGWSRCVLFTDLANPASNAVYARIGYRPLLDFTLYRFPPEEPHRPHGRCGLLCARTPAPQAGLNPFPGGDMAEHRNVDTDDQDERTGGYGGSTGGQDPRPGSESEDDSGAGGRNTPISSPMDADEALGNRTGGYGGNPNTATEQPDGSPRSS